MARPKIAAGELGQVQVTQLANGKWRARARMRDDSGELVQLRAEGPTEGAAREELLSRAKTMTTHTKAIVTAASTIQEAAEAWLPTVRVRAENGTLSWSTYERADDAKHQKELDKQNATRRRCRSRSPSGRTGR